MEMRAIHELQTDYGKRQVAHLRGLAVPDKEMIAIVDDGGTEMITIGPWMYRNLTSEVGVDGVFLAEKGEHGN